MIRRLGTSVTGLFVLILAWLPVYAGGQSCGCDPDGMQDSGAVYRICMPPQGEWNGDLVVYAHGYVAFNEPVAIPEDQLFKEDEYDIPTTVTGLGYALAVTSYSANGLAVQQGLADVVDLVDVFAQTYGVPDHVYIAGVSEGGLVATLALEQFPDVFDGGFCGCGPIGDFNLQVKWFGDFRVALDYFFPGLLPGSVAEMPPEFIDTWDIYYAWVVRPTLFRPINAGRLRQLVRVAHVPYVPFRPFLTLENSLDDILWYNVVATNDTVEKLGGSPFDNMDTYYRGAWNNFRMNRSVARYEASPEASEELAAHYQTSGDLQVPLVTLHTVLDPQVPYRHMPLYRHKVLARGTGALHTNIPSFRYGHCKFGQEEALLAFGLLILQVEGPDRVLSLFLENLLPDAGAKRRFRTLAKHYGLPLHRED